MYSPTQSSDDADTFQVLILFLKTKSIPIDGYQEYFSTLHGESYVPEFVPVLEHRLKDDSLSDLSDLIKSRAFGDDNLARGDESSASRYGGIIFTSQRAVEAFVNVVEELKNTAQSLDLLLPASLPLYVVGPATARGLKALGLGCSIVGEDSGNGEALAKLILEHYNKNVMHKTRPDEANLPLLFLVGEQRRDIIPKTLQSSSLKEPERIEVHELVVYESGEMSTFKSDFLAKWQKWQHSQWSWVVVFSPTGCRAMLECLGVLDEASGKVNEDMRVNERPAIATIGPTTRDFLVQKFGFQPEVCASKPNPEALAEGISAFMQSNAVQMYRKR